MWYQEQNRWDNTHIRINYIVGHVDINSIYQPHQNMQPHFGFNGTGLIQSRHRNLLNDWSLLLLSENYVFTHKFIKQRSVQGNIINM